MARHAERLVARGYAGGFPRLLPRRRGAEAAWLLQPRALRSVVSAYVLKYPGRLSRVPGARRCLAGGDGVSRPAGCTVAGGARRGRFGRAEYPAASLGTSPRSHDQHAGSGGAGWLPAPPAAPDPGRTLLRVPYSQAPVRTRASPLPSMDAERQGAGRDGLGRGCARTGRVRYHRVRSDRRVSERLPELGSGRAR